MDKVLGVYSPLGKPSEKEIDQALLREKGIMGWVIRGVKRLYCFERSDGSI